MSNALISIIVPVYKSEKYLRDCIESIINQSYKNLEVILVDDGSPDACPKICDEYADKDSRIVVIHKENSGVSEARNSGIEKMTGEYVAFVDSDDTVEKEFIEKLYIAISSGDFDVSICNRNLLEKGKLNPEKAFVYRKGNTPYTVEEVTKSFLYGNNALGSACDKLYKSQKVKETLFVKKFIAEDTIFNYNILCKSANVIFIDDYLYNYRQHSSSATHSSKSSKYFDSVNAAKIIYDDANINNKKYLSAAECLYLTHAFFTWFNLPSDCKTELTFCETVIKEHRKNILFNNEASFKSRCACLLSFFGMNFAQNVYSFLVNK